MYEYIEKAINAWLLSFFAAKMGQGSAVTTLKLEDIKIASLRSQRDWEGWQLPALGIANRLAYRTAAGHGGGRVRLYRALPYLLTFVVMGDEQEIVADNLQTLLHRAESHFRNLTHADTATIQSADGEVFRGLRYYAATGDTDAERQAGLTRLRFYEDPRTKKIYGAGDYSIAILTTTGA